MPDSYSHRQGGEWFFAQGRPTGGGTELRPAGGLAFAVAPFSLSKLSLRNGPEPSRARGVGAAKRTLDGEDRSGRWGGRERGPARVGTASIIGVAPGRADDVSCAETHPPTRGDRRCGSDGPGCCRRRWGRRSARASEPPA